ncbi:MAG: dihydrodipicolinate synthase family protein, partial [Paracoccaceae bacterium]
VAAGVDILTVNGNTGEFYSLSTSEAVTMVQSVCNLVDGRVPVIAGIGRALPDALALTHACVATGADALMIHQPPDPFVAPRGVCDYIRAIRDAAGDVPLILYLRNDGVGLDAISQMCSIERVVGVKWATPNPMVLKRAIAAAPDHITWVGGLAEVWAPSFYAVGARGFTSGLINVWPEHSVAINRALEAGDFDHARRLIETMQVFEDIRAAEQGGANVSGVKCALAFLGNDCGGARPPAAWPLREDQQVTLKHFMIKHGLIS